MAGHHNRVYLKVMLCEMRLILSLIGSLSPIFLPLLLMDLSITALPLNFEEDFCASMSMW